MQCKSKRFASLHGAIALFVAIELTLGVLLQTASGRATAVYSYAVVVLACLFCILFFARSVPYACTQAALVCTVCADYFLVWSQTQRQLPAMIFFSITQLAYFARIYWECRDRRIRVWHLASRLAICVVAIILPLAVLGSGADALALVSMFYYANLIWNILFACLFHKRNWLLIVGLILFLCCDTVVGLSCLEPYFAIPQGSVLYRIIYPGFNLAWVFYVPSQVLLALSLYPCKCTKAK